MTQILDTKTTSLKDIVKIVSDWWAHEDETFDQHDPETGCEIAFEIRHEGESLFLNVVEMFDPEMDCIIKVAHSYDGELIEKIVTDFVGGKL